MIPGSDSVLFMGGQTNCATESKRKRQKEDWEQKWSFIDIAMNINTASLLEKTVRA